jgi:sulfate adenylyltransferase
VSEIQRGFCVWLTGLSGAGKTTTALQLAALLRERGVSVTILDGDAVRASLSRGLGFSRDERHENMMRVARVAKNVVGDGGAVICALVSPYEASRQAATETIGREVCAIVHVHASLESCERRDPKGLYAKARRGEIRNLTGVDDPYEAPARPDVRVETDTNSPGECALQIMSFIEDRFLRTGF